MMSEAIVAAVLKDLESRAGFDHWWDDIDEDIQDEIRTELADIVTKVLTL